MAGELTVAQMWADASFFFARDTQHCQHVERVWSTGFQVSDKNGQQITEVAQTCLFIFQISVTVFQGRSWMKVKFTLLTDLQLVEKTIEKDLFLPIWSRTKCYRGLLFTK